MKQIIKIGLFVFLILHCFACTNTTRVAVTKPSLEVVEPKQPKFYSLYPQFSFLDLSAKFQEKIERDTFLSPFYLATNYNLLWIKDTLNTSKLAELIPILSNVDKHGLVAHTFHTQKIIKLTNAIDSGHYAHNIDTLYDQLIELEKLASTSSLKYAVGMRFGFLDPKKLYGESYNIVIEKVTDDYYQQLYTSLNNDVVKTLLDSQPKDSTYILLQNEYQKWDKLNDTLIAKIATKPKATYKLLDKGDPVDALFRRLALTGEYRYADSVSVDSKGLEVDDELLEAVNTFRRENSYFEKPEIDASTLEALNRPMTYYQDKVKANLERYRWRRSKEKRVKQIEVNVASQLLIATDSGRLALEMNVAVGSLKNKTPLLQSDLSYINLNPIWNVPTNITRKELVLKQKKDKEYLSRNDMKLYKKGEEVPINSINWDEVDSKSFDYSIKQAPGSGNALGKMKFIFNNNFAVYLHDTPSRAAFGKNNRAVSHGCVRLQHPADLALFCTSPNDAVFVDKFYNTIDMKALSAEGQKLQAENKMPKMDDIIRPNQKIAIFIDYFTVYLKPNDKTIYYADDVYNYDTPILDGLTKLVEGNTVE